MENGIAVPKNCAVDVIFVLDESGSIKPHNFDLMKSFLAHITRQLRADIDSRRTRVGIATYNNKVTDTINLNAHSSTNAVLIALRSLTYSDGKTFTDRALRHVRTQMLTSTAGDRSNIRNVVVVLTDGRSKHPERTQVCTMRKLITKLPHLNKKLSYGRETALQLCTSN